MAFRLFEGNDYAAAYLKYRISPSETLIEKVLNFLENKREKPFDLAVDVGCGSGQGTVLLAPHFKQVIGVDISPAQLEMAKTNGSIPNVSYRESSAENMPFPDSSFDLVTAMAAAHWFDVSCFLKEADRMLKPRGCLALLSYSMNMELQYGTEECSQRLTQVCDEFIEALEAYRDPRLAPCAVTLYKQIADSIPYPEKEWNDCMLIKYRVPLSRYINMVETFCFYQAMLKNDPEEAKRLSQDTRDKLLTVMGVSSADTEIVMGVKYFYILACKP